MQIFQNQKKNKLRSETLLVPGTLDKGYSTCICRRLEEDRRNTLWFQSLAQEARDKFFAWFQ
jgi:hypothetical protein